MQKKHTHTHTYTGCPTRYRNRHFFNNSNTNEDIATKFEQEYVRCVRNEEECVCTVYLFRCNIFIGVRIIKEMPGSVVSGTPCIYTYIFNFYSLSERQLQEWGWDRPSYSGLKSPPSPKKTLLLMIKYVFGVKAAPMPFFPLSVPHGLIWSWNLALTVRRCLPVGAHR